MSVLLLFSNGKHPLHFKHLCILKVHFFDSILKFKFIKIKSLRHDLILKYVSRAREGHYLNFEFEEFHIVFEFFFVLFICKIILSKFYLTSKG